MLYAMLGSCRRRRRQLTQTSGKYVSSTCKCTAELGRGVMLHFRQLSRVRQLRLTGRLVLLHLSYPAIQSQTGFQSETRPCWFAVEVCQGLLEKDILCNNTQQVNNNSLRNAHARNLVRGRAGQGRCGDGSGFARLDKPYSA